MDEYCCFGISLEWGCQVFAVLNIVFCLFLIGFNLHGVYGPFLWLCWFNIVLR